MAGSKTENCREGLKKVEAKLLEADYEMRELQIEKQVKAQDAKTIAVLDELKSRCRGYYG